MPAHEPIRILIVDDQPLFRGAIASLIDGQDDMVGVGEATGALDAMLSKVADFYEDEVDNAVANLTSLMEPIMIALLGGIIGFIVIAMYMPIFNLANVMGKD